LLTHCVAAFVVVTLTGVWLRTYPLLQEQPFIFKNLLHAHSHFAFAGWLTPALGWALLVSTPELQLGKNTTHMKRAIYAMLASAYGMLLSFPFQGYGMISILFSTVSVLCTYYMAFVICRSLRNTKTLYSSLVRMGACFLAFSSFGAFATGPLAAMGFKDSPLYFDAVYTYLHFYMNGWFCLAAVALTARNVICTPLRRQQLIATLYLMGIILTLPLSYLWHKPGVYLNVAGALGAVLQIWATILLSLQFYAARKDNNGLNFLGSLVMGLMLFKAVLQAIAAIQPVTDYVTLHRPLTVAYLHLITLGISTLSVLALVFKRFHAHKLIRFAMSVFLIGLITTELLLIFHGLGMVNTRHYPMLLAVASCLFTVASVSLLVHMVRHPGRRESVPAPSVDKHFKVILNG
jgi:hypothetical protein